MRIKKILASLLAATMAVSAMAMTASAEDKTINLTVSGATSTYATTAAVSGGGLFYSQAGAGTNNNVASTLAISVDGVAGITWGKISVNGKEMAGTVNGAAGAAATVTVNFSTFGTEPNTLQRKAYDTFTVTIKGTSADGTLEDDIEAADVDVTITNPYDSKTAFDANTAPLTPPTTMSADLAAEKSVSSADTLSDGAALPLSEDAVGALLAGGKLTVTLDDKATLGVLLINTNLSTTDADIQIGVAADAKTVTFTVPESYLLKEYKSPITGNVTMQIASSLSLSVGAGIGTRSVTAASITYTDAPATTTTTTTTTAATNAPGGSDNPGTAAAAMVLVPAVLSVAATVVAKKVKKSK